MKLSLKFFCIAYIIVLLAAGIPSAIFIHNSVSAEWTAKEERLISGINYARSSFYSLSEFLTGKPSDSRLNEMVLQIRQSLDSDIVEFGIAASDSENYYEDIELDSGKSFYLEKGEALVMTCVCKVVANGENYCVFGRSDFGELIKYRTKMWRYYIAAILSVAVIGGILLFVLAKKIVNPLGELQRAAEEIAEGNYGKKVNIKTSDDEICQLAESFNIMSEATAHSLLKLREEAERRERFVSNFTHEMKTPMTAIVGYAQMLNRYELNECESRQATDSIYKEGKRLEALSRQLLELFVTQNEAVELVSVSLSKIAERVRDTMRFSAEKYFCSLSVQLPDKIVQGNEVLLLSLLYNLIDNAFKACEKGGSVTVMGYESEKDILITVKDSGRGIAPEHIKHLTEPFYREDKARSRRQGGAGIGLSLCKEIVQIHGSSLDFQSKQGEGTSVSFRLGKAAEK